MTIVFESKMSYYLFNKNLGSETEIKRNKRIQPLGEPSFFIGRKIMEDIEVQLDLLATQLAELILSQLGYRFIPKVAFITGGTFIVTIGFQMEAWNYPPFCYEALACEVKREFYEYK